ncbi:MAG TPA: AAA family ATPase, partial [Candidatus Limnocylindrales bacterium]|nr:AAA family ATPase [Candidatus Limnocylindrales bacterium]
RSCGTQLALVCPHCGAANEPDDRFCGECGRDMATADAVAPVARQAGAPGSAGRAVSERRLVSVLFADLVGFTAFSDQRDPELVRDLLSRYFELARERIERYGGTVEKFIGDAVMAVWGTPTAQEDDAERAVRAALDLVGAVDLLRIDPTLGELQLRAAVVTGEAAVTVGAVGEGMVAGDLVNTASRLQSVAPPGTVLAGEGTSRAAASAIVFEPVGEQELRGKSAPVPAWRAVRVVAGRRGFGRSARLEPPFVGREDELRLLKELFHATAREQRARLVSVIGVAGIGKSRLAWEFEKYIDGVVDDVYWHQGRSPAYGEGTAYWALGEMVRRRAGIAESDDADESRAKLRATLEVYLPDAEERAWAEPRYAALLGLEPMPPGAREELHAAWRTLFDRVSERGPTVMVFEELQWADAGLLDFIEGLLEWSRAKPITIVTLARPDLLERRPTWGAGQRSFTSLHLEPLAPEAMEMLLLGMAPGLPQTALRAIRDRSEGIPLYAVETVRMLLDQGQLTEHEGRYRLVGEVGALAVPESLHALIAARLDALSAEERALLQVGAVLGQSFTLDAVAVVSGQPVEVAEPALRQLVRKELLVLDADPRSPERGQYRFVQALAREVAYQRLSRRDRQARHLAAAEHFAGLGDELAGVAASHSLEAYRAAADTPEAERLKGQARDALLAAADRARELHAYSEQLARLEDAISITDDDGERLELKDRAATAAFDATVSDGSAVAYSREVLEGRRAQGDRPAIARAIRRLGTALMFEPDLDGARDLLKAGYAEMADLEDEPEVVRLAAELARVHLFRAEPREALAVTELALERAERLDLAPSIAELLASQGWALAEVGRLRTALALLRGALDFIDRHGLTNARNRTIMNLSAWGMLDDPLAARDYALDGAALARRLGFLTWTAAALGNAADSALFAGDWEAIDQSAAEFDRDEIPRGARFNLVDAAITVQALRGDIEGARRRLEPFRVAFDAAPTPQHLANLRITEALVAWAAGEHAVAHDAAVASGSEELGGFGILGHALGARAALWDGRGDRLRERLAAVAAYGLHGEFLDALTTAHGAGAAAMEGDTAAARDGYARALARLRDLRLDFEVAVVLLERAHLLPDDEEAQAGVAEASATFERLGAGTLPQRLGFRATAVAPTRPAAAGPAEPAEPAAAG